MLEIDIKILPFGDRTKSKILHRITIINDATGTSEIGNYRCSIRDGSKGKVVSTCKVSDFPRLDKTALHLLYIILRRFIRRYNVRNKKAVQATAKQRLLRDTPSPDTQGSV